MDETMVGRMSITRAVSGWRRMALTWSSWLSAMNRLLSWCRVSDVLLQNSDIDQT